MSNELKPVKVEILSGEADLKLQKISSYFYLHSSDGDEDFTLSFREAYEILGESLSGCSYSVLGRVFKDLDFAHGEVITRINNQYSIRQYSDGKKFLFFSEDIPTFDEFDREYDGTRHIAIYRDGEKNKFNLITCRFGYKITSIKIYLELNESFISLAKYLDENF